MVKPTTSKLHYKMYKKGKFWIFAGVVTAVLTLGAVDQSAQAATTTDGADQAATTDESATPAKTVTLKSAVSSAATSSSPTATQTTESEVPTTNSAASQETTPTTSADETTDDAQTGTEVNESSAATTDTPAATPSDQDSTTVEAGDVPAPGDGAAKTPVKAGTTEDAATGATTTETEKIPAAVTADTSDPAKLTEGASETEAPQSTATSQATPDLKAAARTVAAPAAMMLRAAAPAVSETIDDWMPNKTLQQWILKALNSSETAKAAGKTWTSVDQITQADMLYLTKFDIQGYGTTYIDGKKEFSLAGLQYATNLTTLDLLNNLNREPHALRGDIVDISPLSALTKLTWLQLSSNRVKDISPVATLKNLTYLNIGLNCIADFSSLNVAQYTKGFSVEQQFVEQEIVYVPTMGHYVMVNPVKAPQGMSVGVATPNAVGIPIFATNFPNATVRIFWTGATGTLSSDGATIDYEIQQNQIFEGQTQNPWAGAYPNLVKEDYTFFLNSNFTLLDASGNSTGIVVTLVTPYINEAEAQNITVKYVDESGNELADSETLTGVLTQPYTTTSKDIAGYVLTGTPANATGHFTTEAQTVTYVYREQTSSVTVNYQDRDGKKIADSETLTGQVGKDYAAKAKNILGYKLAETPTNATGKFTAEDQTVTFVYDETISSVTVNYQDKDGNELAPSETLSGQVGKDYEAKAKDILGYKLTETPTNATGKFTDEAQTVTFVYDEAISSVTVQYQDKEGNELAPSETLSGQVGKGYEAKAKDILGYKLTETPTNATGKFTDEAQTVTFVYDEAISSVTVHYQDKEGNELAPSETLSGQVGKAYEAAAKDILGYKLTETPTNATGKFTAEDQTVTFVYDEAISSVTVNYQDKDGNELAPSETLSGQVGKDYEAKAKDILGYKLTETPTNATGKFTDEAQTVTFVYDEAISSVTVNYQDKDGNELAPSETLSGQVGKAYEAAAKDILGYKLTETPTNATGKFTNEAQTVTFVYDEAISSVTVQYQDKEGNELAPSETLSGQVGKDYEAKAKDILGYKLTETPTNATGKFTDEAQTVTFVYDEAISSVTVNYQDKDGNELAPSETLSGQVGKGYEAKAKDILGYKLTETPTNATGKFTDAVQTVTFVYDEAISSVTVHYQDKDGNELAPAETLSGQVGKAYAANAKTISGYTLTETPANATGQFTAEAQTVLFVYAKDAVTPPIVPPTQQVTVTVKHQTVDGQTVAPDEVLTGQKGDTYTTAPATMTGYRLVKTPTNATGTFTTDETVVYVYEPTDIETGGSGDLGTPEPSVPDQPNPEKPTPETPQKQPDTVHGGQADRVTVTSVATKPTGPATTQAATTGTPTAPKIVADTDTDQTAASQLPQTDEHVTSGWWGLLLLALTGGLVGRFRKHEK